MSAGAGAATQWGSAIAGYREHLEASSRKPETVERYVTHIGWLAESVSAGPWEVTSKQLAGWLDERNWSIATRKRVLTSLRSFYAFGTAVGLCEWAPTAGLPRAERRTRGPAPRRYAPAWEAAMDGFLNWLRAGGRSKETMRLRREWLGRLAEVSADPWAVTAEQLALWLSSPDWAAQTRRSARGSVRVFYRWAEESGLVERSPAARLPSVLVPRSMPRPAPTEAVLEALRGADDRCRLALMLAALAGLRRAEIAGLHTRQIGDTDLLIVGKGGHHRRVPLHPELAEALRVELARRRAGGHGSGWRGRFVTDPGYLFPSDVTPDPITPRHLGKLMAGCLPGDWTAHSLRHWFATSAYVTQRDLRAVQDLLGHASPATTARYAAVPEGALTAAVGGLRLGDYTRPTLEA